MMTFVLTLPMTNTPYWTCGHAWRVLDEFMDALKEAKPETYAGLMHNLKRSK